MRGIQTTETKTRQWNAYKLLKLPPKTIDYFAVFKVVAYSIYKV